MRRISVKNALYEMNLRYESMSNAEELLPLAIEKYSPNPEIVKAIEAEYRQYGIKPLILS
jgi:coenzyme F420-reducing hydrogenase beta subunit